MQCKSLEFTFYELQYENPHMCLIGPTFKGKLHRDLGLPQPQRENKKAEKKTE